MPRSLAIAAVLALASCHSAEAPSVLNLAGDWGGEWKSDTSSATTGVWSGAITQTGGKLVLRFLGCRGTVITDSVTGSITGSSLTLLGVIGDTVRLTGSAYDSAGFLVASGRFAAPLDADCFAGSGSWNGRHIP